MRHLIIENAQVTNVIECDEAFAKEIGAVLDTVGAGIGWTVVDGVFTEPTPAPVVIVYPDLTPRQFLLTAYDIGVTEEMITALIGNDEIAMIEWKHATSIQRSHPLVTVLGLQLGIPSYQLDAMWLYAASTR